MDPIQRMYNDAFATPADASRKRARAQELRAVHIKRREAWEAMQNALGVASATIERLNPTGSSTQGTQHVIAEALALASKVSPP